MVETSEQPPVRGDVVRRVGAVAVGVATVVGCLVAALLEPRPEVDVGASTAWLANLFVVGLAGLVVAWARPRNSIGWLLLAAVFLQMISLLGAAYAQTSYADGDPDPGAFSAAWLASWTWFPSLALPAAVLPSIYPTGRPGSRGRRLLTGAGIVGIVGMCAALGLGPQAPGEAVPGLRLPYSEPPAWIGAAVLLTTALALAVAVIGGLVAATYRAIRAGDPERQQLLWLLVPLWPYVIGYFFTVPWWIPGYAFVGVAVAIGVLRYRLLDIDLVVRRTLFYVPLVVLVAFVVAGVSTTIARVTPSGPLPLIASAAVVAVLIGPVTGWLRRGVDRFMLGARADPVSAVENVVGHGAGVGGDPVSSVIEAMVEAVGVDYAAVLDPTGEPIVEIGTKPVTTVRRPMHEHGEWLGDLVIAAPRDSAGRRIVEALVPHVASVVRNQRLTAQLDAERARVVAATITERERIRRDLHDGLGPSLSGIALGLQAVEAAMSGDEAAARAILDRTRAESDMAVREVRRVLEALGPAGLEHGHLAVAIQDSADRLGFDGESGPRFECVSTELSALPPEVEEAAYRITGEALHNVAQHAGATRCDVVISGESGVLELRISDDGVGLVDQPRHGVGIESMRRRAQAAGGQCQISSRPARGTVIRVRLPLGMPVDTTS